MTFRCPYASPGRDRCPPAICDCFVDLYPDDPFGLHPEAFMVAGECPGECGPTWLIGGATCRECGATR